MTEKQGSKGGAPAPKDEQMQGMSEEEMAWMGDYVEDMRKMVSGQRILYWTLGLSFVLGLSVYIAGYFLRSAGPSGLLGLLADLLYALGWSLSTGVVVTLFVQVIPEAKRRQIKQAIDAYDKRQHENR